MPTGKSGWQDVPKTHWQLAREARQEPTQGEELLWSALRNGQLGVSFRRQHPIGPFIADFYAPTVRIVIEVDGLTHARPGASEYDAARDDYMRSRGLEVLRFSDQQVILGGYEALESIRKAIRDRSSETEIADPPCPPVNGGESKQPCAGCFID